MTVPLMILAALSVVGGWVGWPESLGGSDRFAQFLAPVMAQHGGETAAAAAASSGGSMEYLLMALSVAIAAGGIWLAYRLYIQRPEMPEKIAASSGFLYRLLYRKYYVDEIYDAMFVNRTKDLGAHSRGI